MKFNVLICMVFGLLSVSFEGWAATVVPYPAEMVEKNGFCDLSAGIWCGEPCRVAEMMYSSFNDDFGIGRDRNGVRVEFRTSGKIAEEGYELEVKPSKIVVRASTWKGHLYAVQTLRQLVRDRKIACVEIKDAPAFGWRAFMLDEARHFFGKETVKRLMDDMLLLKMNTFHWHLTDDAGWRIEIRKYPQLTEIGSRRDSTQVEDKFLDIPGETGDPAYDEFLRRYQSNVYDPEPHSGYYTQDDIKEIVAYAAERNIRIVPEISMPGHASAAIASYPWLGTSKEKIDVPCRFGVVTEVYDASSPEVIGFLQDVLKEVASLFPSGYIHIGGDEVKYVQWENSESVRDYMKANDLASCRDLQVKMTNDMCKYIEDELGCRMIGWNEILGVRFHVWDTKTANASERLSSDAIVQFWDGNREILDYALGNGYKVVNSYSADTYMNYTYRQIPLERAYCFSPVPENYTGSGIMGMGCQLWTEWIADMSGIEYHIFPRIAAYAETAWSGPANKSYGRFLKALEPLMDYWKSKGYNLPDTY